MVADLHPRPVAEGVPCQAPWPKRQQPIPIVSGQTPGPRARCQDVQRDRGHGQSRGKGAVQRAGASTLGSGAMGSSQQQP